MTEWLSKGHFYFLMCGKVSSPFHCPLNSDYTGINVDKKTNREEKAARFATYICRYNKKGKIGKRTYIGKEWLVRTKCTKPGGGWGCFPAVLFVSWCLLNNFFIDFSKLALFKQ